MLSPSLLKRVRHRMLKSGNEQGNYFSTAEHRSGVFSHREDWQDQMQEKRGKQCFLSSAKQQAEKGELWGSSEKASRPRMGSEHPQSVRVRVSKFPALRLPDTSWCIPRRKKAVGLGSLATQVDTALDLGFYFSP